MNRVHLLPAEWNQEESRRATGSGQPDFTAL
jgi:hypothetical protein